MDMAKWILCYSGKDSEHFARQVALYFQISKISTTDDYVSLRHGVHETSAVHVIVGPRQNGIDPINLAHAFVATDAYIEVILIASNPSGSLISRAKSAGISAVVAEELIRQANPVITTDAQNQKGKDKEAPQADRLNCCVPAMQKRPALAPEDILADLDEPAGLDGTSVMEKVDKSKEKGGVGVRAASVRCLRKKESGPIFVFGSGRGGTGKTFLASAMACVAAGWNLNVALVDFDLSCGNAFSYFGLAQGCDLVDFCTKTKFLDKEFIASGVKVGPNQNCSLFGPCAKPEMAELVEPYVAQMLTCLSNSFDLVLVDTSSTWTDWVAQAAQACDRLILIADERASAVSSLARCSDLARRLGVVRTRMVNIINRCDVAGRDRMFLEKIEPNIGNTKIFYIEDGEVEVAEYLSCGKVGDLSSKNTVCMRSIRLALFKLLQETGSLPQGASEKEFVGKGYKKKKKLFGKNK